MKIFPKKNSIKFQLFAIPLMIFVLVLGVTVFERKVLNREGNTEAAVNGICPGGYSYVGAGDFCIEQDVNGAGSITWENAALDCQSDGARLCTVSEWAQACELDANGTISLDNMADQEEWADDFASDNIVITVGDGTGSCGGYSTRNENQSIEFRCCKNSIN